MILGQGAIHKAWSPPRESNNHPQNLWVQHKPLEHRITVLDVINPMGNCRCMCARPGCRGERWWKCIQGCSVPLVTEVNHSLDIFGRNDFAEDNEAVVVKEPLFLGCKYVHFLGCYLPVLRAAQTIGSFSAAWTDNPIFDSKFRVTSAAVSGRS